MRDLGGLLGQGANMKRTLIAALTLALALTTFAAPHRRPQAQPGPSPDALGPEVIAEFLDLTEAQETQIRALRATMQATVAPLREQLRANRAAVKAAVDAGNAQQAGQLLIAAKSIRDQIRAARETFDTQFAALLNGEQKAKWNMLQELREARRDARRDDDD
jgi:Spy/CpxP family protein refolding chaperone